MEQPVNRGSASPLVLLEGARLPELGQGATEVQAVQQRSPEELSKRDYHQQQVTQRSAQSLQMSQFSQSSRGLSHPAANVPHRASLSKQ